jgi:hypothetical protein
MRNRQAEKGQRPIPPLPPRSEEHVDIHGHLCAPVARSIDPAPKRHGWKPYWVNINLNDPVQKVVKYKRVEA